MADGTITLIPFSDRSAWEQATARALPGQSWGHAAGLAADGMTPELAIVTAQGAQMILPFHRRSFDGSTDIATLPGLSGALIAPSLPAPLVAWSRYAERQGWVSGYIQLSPLNDDLAVPAPYTCLTTNALYVFDLESWDIDLSVGYKMRRNLKTGNRIGAQLLSDPAQLAPHFPALYADHLARIGGHPSVSVLALDRWFAKPGIIAFGAMLDGQIVNIQMGRRQGDWADLHLAGALPEGRDLQAWLIWQAIEVLRQGGVRWFNIGGYGRQGDGLHWMKARFGATEHPLRSVRQIYDPQRFATLCAQTGTDPASRFFPPYHAPGATTADPKPVPPI